MVGAIFEDSAATGVNGDQGNNVAIAAGAVYVFVRSGTTWTQQAYLKASNTDNAAYFGHSVAISGDTVVVGAWGEASAATGVNGDQTGNTAADSGAVYVFVRSGTSWAQQAYLKASNSEAYDQFGSTVALDGNTIVVGSHYEDSAATGVDGDQSSNAANSAGAAYVFVRSGTTWTQQAYLKASNTDASDFFGHSVAVVDDTVVVGAYGEESAATGVGGDQTDNTVQGAGAVYVFVRTESTWTQQAYLKAAYIARYDSFGEAVAVAGNTVVVGVAGEDNVVSSITADGSDIIGQNVGAAYVFVRVGTAWSQQAYLKASNAGESDLFGYHVAVADDTVVVGAPGEYSAATGIDGDQTSNAAQASGAAYVFVRSGMTWTQQTYLKSSNTDTGDFFGLSVGVFGDTVVIGAYTEDSAATGVDGDQSNNAALSAGAAYVFVGSGPALPTATATPTADGTATATPIADGTATATPTADGTTTATPTVDSTTTATPTADGTATAAPTATATALPAGEPRSYLPLVVALGPATRQP